jgi:hydrogenase 3 maturation protease
MVFIATESLKNQLKAVIKGKTVLVGMGNVLKADDGAGPLLIQRLRQRLNGRINAELFDAGVTPENYLGPIVNSVPATVIIIDAMDHGGKPGTVTLLTQAWFATTGFSTHGMNPEFFINYLKENGIHNITFMGIQPENISLGGEISPGVKQALHYVERLFCSLLPNRNS